MNTRQITSISLDDQKDITIASLKNALEPFRVAHVKLVSPGKSESDTRNFFLSSIDEHLAVECSVTGASVDQQVYFGSEAAFIVSDTLRDTPCSSENAVGKNLLHAVGGIDIMDSETYRKRCLASLRLSLLKENSFAQPSGTTSNSSSGTPGSISSEVLLWKTARRILESRRGMSPEKPQDSLVPQPIDSQHFLETIDSSLCIKVSSELPFSIRYILGAVTMDAEVTPVFNPLLLQSNTYFSIATINEKNSGSRSHVNVMGSHALSVLATGRKKWRIAHPLDKYLLTNEKTGAVADLWSADTENFPFASFARVYEVVQEADEALFIPSDAVHSDIALEDSLGFTVNFVEDSCYPLFEYQTNKNLLLLSSFAFDHGYLEQFTIVDLVIDGPTDDRLDKLLIRGTVWFSDTSALWTELGARVELSAFHECFQTIGDFLLHAFKESHYAVGIPKGYYLCEKDYRLVLHYEASRETYSCILEALHSLATNEHLDFRFFSLPYDAFPIQHAFTFTISQEGTIPSYIPLSVLLNQPWPFEKALIKNCIPLPEVILEKANHPQGFVRPGSVWHYSNNSISRFVNPKCLHGFENDVTTTEIPHTVPARNPALFYCSPLLRIPITLHPRKNKFVDKSSVRKTKPLIHEYSWNISILEKYGRVELLQFKETVEILMQKLACTDTDFIKLKDFLSQHGLHLKSKDDVQWNSESLIATILWILATPCVTGFTCPAGVQFDSGEFISSSDMYQFQMIGLPSQAAISLLGNLNPSPYAEAVTQLCNWVCDIESSAKKVKISNLFTTFREHCDAEMAEILQQVWLVKDSLLKCTSDSNVNPEKLNYLENFIHSLAEGTE